MDEGWIKLKYLGAFFEMGRIELPFSFSKTLAIEKPLTWYLADCMKNGISAGYNHKYFEIVGGIFNGSYDCWNDFDKPADNDMSDYSFKLSFKPLADNENFKLKIGSGYISDITEVELDFGVDYIPEEKFYRDKVGAFSIFTMFEAKFGKKRHITFIGEYIDSKEFPKKVYLNNRGEMTDINAANIELAYFGEKDWWVGGKYQMIDGFDWLFAQKIDSSLKPTQFNSLGVFGGYAFNEHLSIALQVMDGKDDEGDELFEAYFQLLLKF